MREEKKIYNSVAEQCSKRANEYDRKKETQGWRGPDVVFGLVYEFIKPGQSVLDIGIGTGLGSILFHKAGLRVYGMDMSEQMLEVCGSKGFTDDLKVHDLTAEPYPYSDSMFDHVVCIGVLNHFEDLGVVFSEASRILKNDGIFAFIVGDRKSGEESSFHTEHGNSQITMYRHSAEQVGRYLKDGNFELVKELEFPVEGHSSSPSLRAEDKVEGQPMRLKAYAAKRC